MKARIARHKLGSGAAGAHLRYLQRDGTTRDGERGQLYGSERDQEDGRAFAERGEGDRHSFRFIVAPEDGERLADTREFTRDVMRQMEADLGTRLDWVAVDHFNTGHPHSHVVIRGKDDTGNDLIIAQDYITDGVRARAQERATLELGPETDLEVREKLRAEITADRFTRIDRAMIAEAQDRLLDLRPESGQVHADFDRTLRVGRLQALQRFGLASSIEPGVWSISEKLEPTLRELGERGDIIKAINRAMAAQGIVRPPQAILIGSGTGDRQVVGRVIDKRLMDELGDRIGVVIDGADGRVHQVEIGDADAAKDIRVGTIVEAGRRPDGRPADRAIAALSRPGGEYRPGVHRARVESGDVRLPPGADPQEFVDSHVRRLEALRRAGIVERVSAERWSIPADFEQRAAAYDAQRTRQTNLRVLSAFDLDKQVTSDGATWLDRQILRRDQVGLSPSGFGTEVEAALDARTDELVRRGYASRMPEGGLRVTRNLLATLERQEVQRVGAELAHGRGLPFAAAPAGNFVRGTFTGTVELASGKFAVVESPLELQLVPWRPVIDKQLGREVMGVATDGGVSWQIGRVHDAASASKLGRPIYPLAACGGCFCDDL